MARVLSGYKSACLYITLTDTHLVRLLNQRADTPTFTYADFHFELQHTVLPEDLFIYKVTKGTFCMKFFVFGIDVSARCGPLSNVDLVYFIWDNFERISMKQYPITLLLSDIDSFSSPPLIHATSLINPLLKCLKHHRSASEGWRGGVNCDNCLANYQSCVGSRCGCNRSADCLCRICQRQLPSLFASSLDVYTRLARNLLEYELTSNTTYEQYVYAIELEESDIRLLLPPEYPEMRIWFRFAHPDFDRRFHRDCPGAGDWDSEECRTFTDAFAAVDALANEESTY